MSEIASLHTLLDGRDFSSRGALLDAPLGRERGRRPRALPVGVAGAQSSIRYAYTDTTHADRLFETLVSEIELLEATPTTPTTILVHPHALTDFDEMNAFLAEADGYIEDSGRADVFQLVGFHPTSSSAARPKTTRPTGRIARRTR